MGAAFRNHGRPPTEEHAPAQAASPSNVAGAAVQNLAAQISEAAVKGTAQCRPTSYASEPPWETQHASGTTTRAPSEEATLATIVDQNGAGQSIPSGGSWPEVQMAGAAAGNFYTERPSSTTWANPGAHVVPGQRGVAVAAGGSKYPAVSGASAASGTMAVPVGVHGNGQTYAMPTGGFQQFMQPGRAQRVQGGYYMPAQPMPDVRFQHASRVQQPQAQARQMAPGGYYIMQCDPQHAAGMSGMPASAPPQGQQAVHSPSPMQQQQQQQQKSPRAGGGSVQLVSPSVDGSPSIHSASGHSPQQARPSQLFTVEHSQQVMLRYPQMYTPGSEKGAMSAAGSQQVPAGGIPGAPSGATLVPVAAARSHSHMFMSPQSDATGGVASGSQVPSDQTAPRLQRTTNARTVGGGGVLSKQMQGSASVCSSNPSAASSQSNAVYVDFRQGAVMPGGAQQPASPAGAQQRQGQLRGPVFCVAQPQWQHAGRPVYTLQQLQQHSAGVQLQHHAAPVCYVQGGYMPQGRQHAVYPSSTGHRSPRDSTADHGSEEPEQEQQVLDGAQ